MRQFFKKLPTLYAGTTGRQIRQLKGTKTLAKDAFILADYLMACPAANQYGLYILEPEIVTVHLPLTVPEFETAVAALEELDFARYDEPTRWVWVKEMAAYQLGAPLKPQDNQVASVKRWYAAAPKNPFLGVFFDRYAEDLCLAMHTERGGPPVARRGEMSARRELELVPPPAPEPTPAPVVDFTLSAPSTTKPPRPKVQSWREVAFEQFWDRYPKKTEHKRGFQAFSKVAKTPELAAEIQAGLERLLPDFDFSEGGKWIPAPHKWLERERWRDEPSNIPIVSQRTQTTAKAVAAAARRGAPR
jgi:hypothetical protein